VSLSASAPAKLVLLGEYAVLEGAPALVAAVDRRVHVDLAPTGEATWLFTSDLPHFPASIVEWSAEGIEVHVEPGEHEEWTVMPGTVIECLCGAAGVDPWQLPPLAIHIASRALFDEDGTTKLGLGSSAAAIVALAAAFRAQLHAWGHLVEEPGPLDALLENLWIHAETQEGRGSGLDVAAATLGGVLSYRIRDEELDVDVVELPRDVRFTTVWTGTASSTRTLLEGMEAFEGRAPETYARHMARLGELCEAGAGACRTDDAGAWLEVVRAWTPAMVEFGRAAGLPIVTAAHERLAALAEGPDTAYKPSGAGGGDVGLLFARSAEALAKTARRAEEWGYRCIPLRVEPDGVKIRQAGRPLS